MLDTGLIIQVCTMSTNYGITICCCKYELITVMMKGSVTVAIANT